MEIQNFLKKIERITGLIYVSIERNFKCYGVSLRFIWIRIFKCCFHRYKLFVFLWTL